MKNTLKFGLAALALAAVVPAFAVSEETVAEEGPVGWTPIAIGIATPVQLPWGLNRWDVFGLDLYEAGLGERIEGMVRELYACPGAVRTTLHKYVTAR